MCMYEIHIRHYSNRNINFRLENINILLLIDINDLHFIPIITNNTFE